MSHEENDKCSYLALYDSASTGTGGSSPDEDFSGSAIMEFKLAYDHISLKNLLAQDKIISKLIILRKFLIKFF